MARLMFLTDNSNESDLENSELQEDIEESYLISEGEDNSQNDENEEEESISQDGESEEESITQDGESEEESISQDGESEEEESITQDGESEEEESITQDGESEEEESISKDGEIEEEVTNSQDGEESEIEFIEVVSTAWEYVQTHTKLVGSLSIIGVFLIGVLSVFFVKIVKKSKANKKAQVLEPRTVKMSTGRGLSVKVSNVHNVGKRKNQQDSFGMSMIENSAKNGVLAVVADGMGGLEAGAESSNIITNCMLGGFKNYLGNNKDKYSYNSQDFLLKLLKLSNEQVVKMLKNNNVRLGGSTLVGVLIKDNLLDFISVGDSRIALLRSGALTTINREHTYAVELDEKMMRGEISFEEAKNDSQRKSLTSYVGMDRINQVDRSVQPIPLVSGDKLILMSDGIFGTLSDEEIVQILSSNDVYTSASVMEQSILNKNKSSQDNFTAIIIEIEV